MKNAENISAIQKGRVAPSFLTYSLANRGRYCRASSTCASVTSSPPARSAMVRASRNIRWYERGERSRVFAARASVVCTESGIPAVVFRIFDGSSLLVFPGTDSASNRSRCFSLAESTRERTSREVSPGNLPASFSCGTCGISIQTSMRSTIAPESFFLKRSCSR